MKSDDGQDLLIYEHKATGELYTIPDPHLRLDQLAEVQQQVVASLQPASAPAVAEPAVDEKAAAPSDPGVVTSQSA